MKKLFIIGLLLSGLANANQNFICDTYETYDFDFNKAKKIGNKNAKVFTESSARHIKFGFSAVVSNKTLTNDSPDLDLISSNPNYAFYTVKSKNGNNFVMIEKGDNVNNTIFAVSDKKGSRFLAFIQCEKID